MNMFSQKFASLIDEFPEERETISRLREMIESSRHREMTLDHLILQVSPHSVESLLRILERLAFQGTINRLYRVESPRSRGKIEDFASYSDIPETIYDYQTGTELRISPQDLRVVYSFA